MTEDRPATGRITVTVHPAAEKNLPPSPLPVTTTVVAGDTVLVAGTHALASSRGRYETGVGQSSSAHWNDSVYRPP